MSACRTLTLLAMGFAGVLLASCILLVSPPSGGDSCRFAGTASSCGACAAMLCQTEVNDCCSDTRCAGTLQALESCGTKQDQSCVTLQTGSGAGASGSLSACIAQSCRGVCQPFVGKSETSCSEPSFGQGSVCSCELSSTPNDFACGPAVYPNTLCCAPQGWPAPGLQCSCQMLDCAPSPDGCFCMLASYTPAASVCGGSSGTTCCVDRDVCSCRSAPMCNSFEAPVSSCSVAAVACGTGQQRVESCSIRSGAGDGG